MSDASHGSLDRRFWDQLRALRPAAVCARTLATFDESRKGYVVRILNEDHLVLPAERRVECAGRDAAFDAGFIAVHYLLNAQAAPLAGELVSPKQLKGGERFFAGGCHAPHTAPLLKRFDGKRAEFYAAGAALGGPRVNYGDAAVELPALPRVPVTVILWFSDDEFPARASVLFDRSVENQLPLDALCPLISETVRRLAGD